MCMTAPEATLVGAHPIEHGTKAYICDTYQVPVVDSYIIVIPLHVAVIIRGVVVDVIVVVVVGRIVEHPLPPVVGPSP